MLNSSTFFAQFFTTNRCANKTTNRGSRTIAMDNVFCLSVHLFVVACDHSITNCCHLRPGVAQ